MADLGKLLKKLKPLVVRPLQIPGWLLALSPLGRWLYKTVDFSSNLDWLYTAFRSDLMGKLWALLISPTGTFMTMVLGLG